MSCRVSACSGVSFPCGWRRGPLQFETPNFLGCSPTSSLGIWVEKCRSHQPSYVLSFPAVCSMEGLHPGREPRLTQRAKPRDVRVAWLLSVLHGALGRFAGVAPGRAVTPSVPCPPGVEVRTVELSGPEPSSDVYLVPGQGSGGPDFIEVPAEEVARLKARGRARAASCPGLPERAAPVKSWRREGSGPGREGDGRGHMCRHVGMCKGTHGEDGLL